MARITRLQSDVKKSRGYDSPPDQETEAGSENMNHPSVLESSVLLWGIVRPTDQKMTAIKR